MTLQRPRTPQRAHLRLEHERTHAPLPQPILRLPDLYSAEFRMPAEFFSPRHASEGVDECPAPSLRPGSRPSCAAPPVPTDASPPQCALPQRPLPSGRPLRLRPPARSTAPAPKLGLRSQSRHQRLIAQLRAIHPPPPAKSMQTEPTLHRFESQPQQRAPLRSLALIANHGRLM